MDPSNVNNPTVPPQSVPPLVPVASPVPIPVVPISNPTQPEVPSSPTKKFPWKWVILGSIVLIFIVFVLGIITFLVLKPKYPVVQNDINTQDSFTPIAIPTDTPKPVTIAPPGTPDFALSYYRSSRATTTDAQQIDKDIGTAIGAIPIPPDLKFVHEEVYKGIPISWTAGQPIPDDRLAWLKAAIDKLPPFFVVDHPVIGIISATPEELKLTGGSHTGALMAFAYASGLNIFIGDNMLVNDSLHMPPNQKDIDHTLFHEWTHVIQYYEVLQTFTEDYLKLVGAGQAMRLTPYVHDFAVTAGWDYAGYGPATWDGTPKLKTDAESQKISDYGKEYEYEDQAETMGFFMTCDTGVLSQARIQWAEKSTNTTAASYCH